MAREAYRPLLGDLKKLKDSSLLNDPAGGTGDDDELFQLLLATSEAIERYCNRNFIPIVDTRYFDGTGTTVLFVPDLTNITTLKEDVDLNKSWETTWATTDYWKEPSNASPEKHWGRAYTNLRVREQGTKSEFALGVQNFEILGVWGFSRFTEPTGALINDPAGITATATTITIDGGLSDAEFAIGQTIQIDAEYMLVTNIAANTLTVARALNGTTPSTHADNTAISIVRPPAPVERATLITAARIWTRAPAFEPFYVGPTIDPDVRWLLEPYRRVPV